MKDFQSQGQNASQKRAP